jgi:hypothetical protein
MGSSRGADSPSLGPPELRLYANEPDDRAEPLAPPPVPLGAPAPRVSGPSDFTRMLTPVEAAPAAPMAPAVKPNAKPDQAGGGRRPSLLPIILVVMFALVTAAALIVFFALRK